MFFNKHFLASFVCGYSLVSILLFFRSFLLCWLASLIWDYPALTSFCFWEFSLTTASYFCLDIFSNVNLPLVCGIFSTFSNSNLRIFSKTTWLFFGEFSLLASRFIACSYYLDISYWFNQINFSF